MTATLSPVTAIVLAGQRPGPDRVAAPFGLRTKALVPVLGRPMIDRLIEVLQASPHIARVIIAEDRSLDPLGSAPGVTEAVAGGFATLAPSAPKISESVAETIEAQGADARYLVTTADNPLLTEAVIADFLTGARDADIAIGMAEKQVIEATYPDIPRTYYRFKDTAISGANLFYVSGAEGLKAIRFWSYVEQHRKNPVRLFAKFGLGNLALMLTQQLSLAQAFERASGKIGCRIKPVLLPHAEAAIDVDKPIDLLIAEAIIARREASGPQTLGGRDL